MSQLNENKIVFKFTNIAQGKYGCQHTIDPGTSLSDFLRSIDFPTNIENVMVIVNGTVMNSDTYYINAGDNISISSKKQAGGS